MAGGTQELFAFSKTPHLVFASAGATDATSNVQQVGNQKIWGAVNANQSSAFVEPEQLSIVGDKALSLDSLTRLLMIGIRTAGSGTWEFRMRFRRTSGDAGDDVFTEKVPMIFAGAASGAGVSVLDNPFPNDFLRAGTGVGLTDVVTSVAEVTPGSVGPIDCAFIAMLVPGPIAGGVNRGSIFSAEWFNQVPGYTQ